MTEAPHTSDDQAARWARREPLLALLSRAARGVLLPEEGSLLRATVETELAAAELSETRHRERFVRVREISDAMARTADRYRHAWRSARRRARAEHDRRQDAERQRDAVLRIVSDWCVETNEHGGLAWRLETAGYPLPDEDAPTGTVADRAAQIEAERDGAYRERAQLLAWLATLVPSVITPAADVYEDGWRLLFLHTPQGQLSWHIHPRDVPLFDHVQQVPDGDPRGQWDGHTTEEKYGRIRALIDCPACLAGTEHVAPGVHCPTPETHNAGCGCPTDQPPAAQLGEQAAEVVHGCPPDGSGLTPCCGRSPFELPLGDRISSEASTTCPGQGGSR